MSEPTAVSSPVPSGWMNQRKLFWLAGGLATLLLLMGVSFVLFQRNEIKTSASTQIELYTKLLEQQTSADISAIEASVKSVSQRIDILTDQANPQVSTRLADVIQGRPQLRSLSILDHRGHVLHSSSPGNLGVAVELTLLGSLPQAGAGAVLGPGLKGRDLSSLQSGANGAGQFNVLPLLQRFSTESQETLTLVALINIDYFSAQHELIFDDPALRVALVSYGGEFLGATTNVALSSGVSLRHLPVFTDFLPLKESGNFIGAGLMGDRVISSFRTTRRWPLLVLVEKSYDEAMVKLRPIRNWTLAGILLAWLVILAMAVVLARSLRRDAAIQAQLRLANLSVFASESRLRATLESSIDAVLAINDSGRIIAFNPAAERIFDRTSAEVMGQPMEDFLVPGHLRHDHRAGLKQYIETHEGPVLRRLNRRMETVGMRRDGRTFPIELTIVSSTDQGHIFFTATVRDITELRDTEAALRTARRAELDIGNRIQQSLLTANPSQRLPGLWLSAYNQPSKGVDGDFFDVIRMGDHCVDILAGDVMGKGVPAALMGAATKLQFSRSIAELLTTREHGSEPPRPSAIVTSVHATMTPHLQSLDAFVTLVYVRLDSLRNVITWVGCGHEETLVVRGCGAIALLPNQHPPLGVLERQDFTQDEAPLAVGDAVFLYSDGLTDAMGAHGERIGRDVVKQAVQQLVQAHPSPAAALHALRRQILRDEVQVVDDITMVLLKRAPAPDTDARCELPIALGSLRAFREFISAHALRAGLPEEAAAMFVLAAVEVFTNIIRHAQGLLPGAPVELIVRASAEEFTLDIVHLGDAFTPPQDPPETDLTDYPEGGFGLTIIPNSCDRVDYLHHQGVNTVRMTHWITSPS